MVNLYSSPINTWCLSWKQYDYQFRKWGLQKYGLTKTTEEESRIPSIVQSHLTTVLPTVLEEEFVTASNPNRKRRCSTHDAETSGSGLPFPLPSSSKKVKMGNKDRAPRHEHLELLPVSLTPISYPDNTDTPDFNETFRYNNDDDQTLRPTSPTFELPVLTLSESPVGFPTMVTTKTRTSDNILSDRTQLTASPDSIGVQLKLESVQSLKVDQHAYHLQLDKAVHLAQSVQQFSPDILSSLLDVTSQRHLLRVADCLDAFLDREQSFAIYKVLLAAEQATDRCRTKAQILSPAMLSCARAAETSSQRDIVREALSKRMESSKDHNTSPSEKSLAHMLLAQMFALDGQDSLALLQSNTKWNTTVSCGPVDTSFDVLAYLYYKSHGSRPFVRSREQSRPIPELTGWDAFTRKRPTSVQLASVNLGDFNSFALGLRHASLQLQPVPSDLPDPTTPVSVHLRSCLDWCINSIDDTFPGVTSSPSPFHWKSRTIAETLLPDTLAVYSYLHEQCRWEWHYRPEESFTCWKWMENTSDVLGISASELLIVCCDMVMWDNTPRMAYDYYLQLRLDFKTVKQLSDEKLVTRFLQRLYLRVVPSAWAASPTTTESENTREGGYEPTIAPSLGSSNLSYRRMRDAAASVLKRRFSPMGSEISLLSHEKMAAFTISIDSLSDMVRDSLSISNRRE